MKTFRRAAVLGFWLLGCCVGMVGRAGPLPRSTPEAQGVSPEAVLGFIEAADRQVDSLHSFMLVRHGSVVAEGWWAPYRAEDRHELYSLSKSFTSTAVGFAVAEGLLSIDDPVTSFFPEEVPAEASDNLKSMRVRDLLCMSAGHEKEVSSAPGQISARSFLAHPVPFKPGTRFLYNTPATFMQSAIVQKRTGLTVLDYLMPRLFEPLGIERPVWNTNFQGISLGGYGLSVRTEDIAKFGQFCLQKGRWQGRQLLPAAWVEQATSRQTSNGSSPNSDWDQGYGFQFWRCRHGAYRGDGAFGQYCIVLPEKDAVVAITSGLGDMQAVMNLVWDKLLPGMQAKRVPKAAAARQALQERLARLSLRPVTGGAASAVAERVRARTFAFPANDRKLEAVAVRPGPGAAETTLVLRADGREQQVVCGQGTWVRGRLGLVGQEPQPVACSGAWTKEDAFTAKICLTETPFVMTMTVTFAGDEVSLDSQMNVGFGNTRQPRLTAKAQ